MNIGEIVLYEGRQYYLRGLDPMGVPERQAFLEDASTGEARTVPVDELELDAAARSPTSTRSLSRYPEAMTGAGDA